MTQASPRQVVLAENLPAPDDLLLLPDGSLLVSDVEQGSIVQVAAAGAEQVLLSGLSEPEGMVSLPDGTMVIAEQGKNDLVRYDPRTKSVSVFLKLENRTRQLGVDGIALDAHDPGRVALIVPDSPNGTLLRVSLDTKEVTVIARGFERPTGAWVEADGSILVVDENGGTLSRVHPDGRVEGLARLPVPDDMIEDPEGIIYISTLGDGAIHWIEAGTGRESLWADDFASPQGLAFDAQGNLVVSDPGRHRLVKLLR